MVLSVHSWNCSSIKFVNHVGTKKLLAMELLATQNGRETSKDFHPSNVFYVQGLQIRDKFLLGSIGLR